MSKLFSIELGNPKHGWLPVDFHSKDLHLEFAASDVLNNPLEELYRALTKLDDKQKRRVTWWMEPGAYFFDFERRGQFISLIIFETSDLRNSNCEEIILLQITGNEKEILKPFRSVLKQFSSNSYEEKHWTYKFEKNEINDL